MCFRATESLAASASSSANTATVCALFQSAVVNVSVCWSFAVTESVSTVTSESAKPPTVTVTVADGRVASFTV